MIDRIPVCFVVALLFALAALPDCAYAQRGRVSYYPPELYFGENIIRFSSPEGIERITFRTTPNVVVSAVTTSGCEDSVDVPVQVNSVTTEEQLTFTVFQCDGTFTTRTIRLLKWEIRHEYTGNVLLGSDTCIRCEVRTDDGKQVDSIVTRNPNLRVETGFVAGGPYRVQPGVPFNYRVCYSAERPERFTDTVYLYMHRDYPMGKLTQYVIPKPISVSTIEPPLPVVEKEVIPSEPPLYDPTTFRNIVMPTAESVEKGKFFLANYDIAGLYGGYGVTDRLTLTGGGVLVPDFISRLLVGTLGAKYEFARVGSVNAAAGFQYAVTSSDESDITLSAPYAVVSYGDKMNRLSVALGYSWKHHVSVVETFDRQAYIISVGGNLSIARGWKLAAETYVVETSGVAPLVLTARWFNPHFAFDFGLGIDLASGNDVKGTSFLAGEADNLAIAPVLSAMWVW